MLRSLAKLGIGWIKGRHNVGTLSSSKEFLQVPLGASEPLCVAPHLPSINLRTFSSSPVLSSVFFRTFLFLYCFQHLFNSASLSFLLHCTIETRSLGHLGSQLKTGLLISTERAQGGLQSHVYLKIYVLIANSPPLSLPHTFSAISVCRYPIVTKGICFNSKHLFYFVSQRTNTSNVRPHAKVIESC